MLPAMTYQLIPGFFTFFIKYKRWTYTFTNIRPWIQDFNLGAIYTPEMVRLQMKAIADMGLTRGWMVWNPNNKYREAIFVENSKP